MSSYLSLPSKPAFYLVYFLLFMEDKSLLILHLLIPEYLDEITPWKEMKEAFVKIVAEDKN